MPPSTASAWPTAVSKPSSKADETGAQQSPCGLFKERRHREFSLPSAEKAKARDGPDTTARGPWMVARITLTPAMALLMLPGYVKALPAPPFSGSTRWFCLPTPMDPPSSAVSREALQRRAYLLAEAAGFPSGQSEHFWLLAEQQLAPGKAKSSSAAAAPAARKTAAAPKRKTPTAPPAPAAEAAPVHPTRRKPATKAAAKPAATAPAKSAAAKKAPAKPAAKAPGQSIVPPPPKSAPPAAKRPAKPQKPKTGDAL